MSTRIKICGITSVDDAVAVASLGADEIGLNFYRHSPRYVGLSRARDITAAIAPTVRKVGVFVNASAEAVLSYAQYVGLDAIQLHGDETDAYVHHIRQNTDAFLIRAIGATAIGSIARTESLPIDAILVDSPHNGEYGGTGQAFDWGVLAGIRRGPKHLYLAGGLGPENVSEAIRQLRPSVVDACSRLESVTGRKDLIKVEEFIREVRQAQ